MKKRVVCFGDSNTWGYKATNKERFEDDERWTGLMQEELGDKYTVIEEGLNGRTTVWDDPIEVDKNGYKHLFTVLKSHKPFDLIIIMLGTNDLKSRFSVTAYDIARSAALLASEAMSCDCGRSGNPPKVLLAAPIPLGRDIMESQFSGMFQPDCFERSLEFDRRFSDFANEIGCFYINAGDYAAPDPLDCIHLTSDGHKALASAMTQKVKSIIG